MEKVRFRGLEKYVCIKKRNFYIIRFIYYCGLVKIVYNVYIFIFIDIIYIIIFKGVIKLNNRILGLVFYIILGSIVYMVVYRVFDVVLYIEV